MVAGGDDDDPLLSGDVSLSISPTPVFLSAALVVVKALLYLWMEARAIFPVGSLTWLLVVADELSNSCLAQSGVRDPEAIEFFFVTVLT